eukprot:4722525-Pleurochrysis_carterae.AAC.1
MTQPQGGARVCGGDRGGHARLACGDTDPSRAVVVKLVKQRDELAAANLRRGGTATVKNCGSGGGGSGGGGGGRSSTGDSGCTGAGSKVVAAAWLAA